MKHAAWKKINKIIFADGMTLHIENPTGYTKPLLELKNKFINVTIGKINAQNQLHLYTITINLKIKLGKKIHLQ